MVSVKRHTKKNNGTGPQAELFRAEPHGALMARRGSDSVDSRATIQAIEAQGHADLDLKGENSHV